LEKIDQKLDQWIYNCIIRAEIRKIIVDYVISEKTEGFKEGWEKSELINNKVNKIINKNNER
jgi:hypothetical protein